MQSNGEYDEYGCRTFISGIHAEHIEGNRIILVVCSF